MSAGDPWLIPGGHKALEMENSTRDVLLLRIIKPPWLGDQLAVPRVLCTPVQARYHGRQDVEADCRN